MKFLSGILVTFVAVFAASGCGGAKILKESKPVERTDPLMIHANDDLTVALVWIIVRDGPGTWAKNADWDEYHLIARNRTGEPLEINSVTLVDRLGHEARPSSEREALVDGTKATKRRYKDQEIEVQAGFGVVGLLATGTVVTAGALAIVGATASAGPFGLAAATTGMAVIVIAVPVVAILAIRRGYNNRRVQAAIEKRHTSLPTSIDAGGDARLALFYSLTPAPQRIIIDYTTNAGPARLELETSELLRHLHLPPES